jgi:Uma2 family endonuclease
MLTSDRMAAHDRWARRDDNPTEDHFVHLHGVSWEDYERIVAMRGDHSAPRISYLDGWLVFMSPSSNHELITSRIARLVEVWCFEHDVDFNPVGSWTIGEKRKRRAAEPDECYVFGPMKNRKVPDLAIEVVWTSGGIDKLEIYRKLGVREVWFWEKGVITPYRLHGERYRRIATSKVLPGIDLPQLATFLDRSSARDAMREYRAALRRGRRKARQ